uniref:Uncharacterized protein n=1 Tax=Arion vulgaris TaxID=1028688 RepID=A0A0B7BCN8_9EUPU
MITVFEGIEDVIIVGVMPRGETIISQAYINTINKTQRFRTPASPTTSTLTQV